MSGFTSIVVPAPENTPSPEKIQATLARVDSAHSPSNPQPSPVTPDSTLLAGKYKTPEELEKGYKEVQAYANRLNTELQKVRKATPVPSATEPTTEPAPAAPAPIVPETAKAEQPEQPKSLEIEVKAAEETLEAKGLSFDKYAESYAQNGKLTDADLAELEKAGIGRQLVETYVRGVEALREQTIRQGHELVGGQETFAQMVTWASTGLSKAEIEAYNESVAKGGEHMKLALLGLKSRWQAQASTVESSLIGGQTTSAPAGYQSLRELSLAQRDPRYGKDPAYTREVEAKAMVSKF